MGYDSCITECHPYANYKDHEIQDMDINFAVTEIWDITFFFKQRI